ncbi:hypothetical protein J6590_102178 [Homalodisca vitripennis]|nr:hypothetical protein J6590_102178 [Homalodisca vitripennis]
MDNPRPSTSALSDTAIADELGLDEELSGFSSDSDEEVILPTLENLSDEDSDDSDEGNLGQGPSQSNRPSTDWCAYNGPDFVQYSYTNASGGYKPPSTNKPLNKSSKQIEHRKFRELLVTELVGNVRSSATRKRKSTTDNPERLDDYAVAYSNGIRIIFLVPIQSVDRHFVLYQSLTFPVYMETIHKYVSLEDVSDYLAVANDHTNYATLTERDLKSCTKGRLAVCDPVFPIRVRREESCEALLFQERGLIVPEVCQRRLLSGPIPTAFHRVREKEYPSSKVDQTTGGRARRSCGEGRSSSELGAGDIAVSSGTRRW